MRPRRHTLQVNTFPFLAVLLCAMGSLILLMLVIDRRARVVARAKALKAAEAALADDRSRQSEWEERRRILHQQLADENEGVTSKIRDVRSQIEGTTRAFETERQTSQSLRDEIEAVKRGLQQQSTMLSVRRVDTASARDKDQASQSELARLTDELMKMERTLSDVKEFRKRRQQAYSLVPYQGKKGDNRRPVYIECTAAGIVFHPGAVPFRGIRFNRTDVRSEIERRAGRDGITLSSVNESAEKNVYLLMLIRPEGITTYYRTLAMVQGINIDFGYEFVDRDWVLDFGDAATSKQPWMQQAAIPDLPRNSAAAKKVDGIRPFPDRAWQSTVQNDKTTNPGENARAAGESRAPVTGNGGGAAAIPEQGKRTPQEAATGISQLPVTLGAARSRASTGSRVSNPAEQPRQPGDVGFAGEHNTGLSPQHVTAAGENGLDQQSNRFGVPGNQKNLSGVPAGSDPPLVDSSAGAERPGDQGSPADQSASTPGIPSPSVGSSLPQLGPPTGTAPAVSQQSAIPSTGKPTGAQTADNPGGDSGSRLPSDPLSRLTPGDSTRRSQRPLPFTGLLNSNRDWIITVECLADAVILSPSRQRIANARLVETSKTNALYQAVETMIARRQASLRPGELPYRPMIRFRVRPDGARTYYSAYPVLEPLGVPMSRENIELESKHD